MFWLALAVTTGQEILPRTETLSTAQISGLFARIRRGRFASVGGEKFV